MVAGLRSGQQSGRAPPVLPVELSHGDIRRQFGPYLADELADREQTQVATHLSHCPSCATALVHFLQSLRCTIELLHTLPTYRAPSTLRQRLLAIPDQHY